jgi:hypothetical protein
MNEYRNFIVVRKKDQKVVDLVRSPKVPLHLKGYEVLEITIETYVSLLGY